MEVSLVGLSVGTWIASSLGVAARLGIADALAEGPATGAELAKAVGAHPDAIPPLLRTLAMVGVFGQDEEGRYVNSALSEQLRTDHPRSLRHLCALTGGLYFQASGGLLDAVRTGRPALPFVFGAPLYEQLERDPETAAIFDRAMEDLARPVAAALAEHYPFKDVRTVVDVGGGNGALLKGILTAHPHLRGICADRPEVCGRARDELRGSGDQDLIDRLTFQPVDVFKECPAGADLYVLKNVLHDWSSDSAVRILRSVRDAMRAGAEQGGRPVLLVIDPLVEHDAGAAIRPLIKLVIGEDRTRERSEADLRGEAAEAGLEVLSVTPLPPELTVAACALAP
ncbi:methyltransferase [Actinomadura verrucosospora]|uniref:Hydroxyneurosporene-O-methyltransferase n=1 Tax=Actinomadura verrucosospora TaxID=46165 RepID=A0A7D3VUJ0_ACTVE|nr:methyltransferase [Actinomadura verrucosospora]QKG19172.1 hydroxyneurosporene-O-methyltransferase [Actinomadura verrucosospora]